MPEHNSVPQELVDEIISIRKRLGDLNRNHHRSIRDQLELVMDNMRRLLDEKQRRLEEYVQTLRRISKDDIGQALLDNVLEQIKQIRAELHDTIEVQDDDTVTHLEDANRLLSKNYVLLNLINRLQAIETTLHTHVGDPAQKDN